VSALYDEAVPEDLHARVLAAAAAAPVQRLRVSATPAAPEPHSAAAPGGFALVEIAAEPLAAEPAPEPVTLAPAVLPGGLGAHKWRDRRLLDELAERLDAVPLLLDLDGDVLEAAYANLFIVEGTHLITPPLDGRQLPGTVRARVLALHPASEERLSLDRVAAADELLLASSVRGIHPARLSDGPEPRFQLGARLRTALLEDSLGAVAR
jgi:para-aminobenzoate synthetase/4-amino-4-deoxychorismate lyase